MPNVKKRKKIIGKLKEKKNSYEYLKEIATIKNRF